jgi:hypothetical protein
MDLRRTSEHALRFLFPVFVAMGLLGFAVSFVFRHGKDILLPLGMGLLFMTLAIFSRRINHAAWRKLAEAAERLGMLEDPSYAPLAQYLDSRAELEWLRRSRAVYVAVAAAAPFVIGFYVYGGFVERNVRVTFWIDGATILVVFVTWLWSERRYRLAVFARAAEQGLL